MHTVNDIYVEDQSIGRIIIMDNKLPTKLMSHNSSGQHATKVRELNAKIQQLRECVQEKELMIRKNEISSNFKVVSSVSSFSSVQ